MSIVVLPSPARRFHPAGSNAAGSNAAGSNAAGSGSCGLDATDLLVIAEGLAVTASFDRVPIERGTDRGCLRLLETAAYDAWLIAWASTSVLELHDHGGSFGVVHVVEGELVETYSDGSSRDPLRSRVVGAGDTLVVPSTCIHEVWNARPNAALSVHVYSPPLATMTFYDHRPEHYLQPVRTSRGDLPTVEEVGAPRPAG